MLLIKLAKAFQKAGLDYALVGGYAVALHGAVRGTMDVDIVIRLRAKDFDLAEKTLGTMGLQPRLPLKAEDVFKFREEYIRNRKLIAWSFYDPANPAYQVDIIITHDLSKAKAVTLQVQGTPVKVLAAPDLIAMKRDAGRPQDLEDVQALEKLVRK